MIRRRKSCPTCKRGREQIELDSHSSVCPYINCFTKKGCTYYVRDRKPVSILKLLKRMVID